MRGSAPRTTPAAGAAILCVSLLVGCAYFNALYNARRAFEDAQAARLHDQPLEAASSYQEAIDKAARSYRSDESGRWADDALYIMGRAYFHSGDWARSRAALERLLATSSDSSLHAGARVYLGGVALATGRRDLGMRLLDEALEEVPDAMLRAEAHLWRARAAFDAGRAQEGWAGLDRSEAASRELRVPVALERLVRGLDSDHFEHARAGATTVLEQASGEAWADTVLAAAERASMLWGAGSAAAMLAAAERSEWAPVARGRVRLERARLLARAGDSVAAGEMAGELARGDDRTAREARIALARWRLNSVDRLEQLEEIRAILLPAIALAEAVRLIDYMEYVGLFVERAALAADHLALFAGAELARDSLGSPRLALQLFTLYADRDRGSAWEAKALMAALELTGDAEERQPLAARLNQLDDNIYVRASAGAEARPSDYAMVEGRLGTSLAILHQRVAVEAANRDVAVREAARTLDSIRAAEELVRRIAAGDSLLLDSLRLDSLRLDSLRADSLRRNAPGATSTDAFFAPDTVPRTDSILPADSVLRRDTIPRRDTLGAAEPSPGPGRPASESEAGAA
ncbi:MAG: tetratricopeptide repeat protein [Gammaproteobacteria bacterium]|nr:tetratricopeptide repeat protein [Gammaproteobacteria bacterium]MYK69393.1 tetratricopeptide repeat protein [Gammaproteobacteria bacterium]